MNRRHAPRRALRALAAFLTAVPAAAWAAPQAKPAAEPAARIAPPELPHTKLVLPNGLNVILHEDHSTPIVAVNLWYHVGSKNEKPGKTGFAHLFEHMMFQGSEHHDADFIEALEPMGATTLNGTTNFDRTNYFENVPKGALERTLWLEADRMGWLLPAMTQERLDNQREVVKNERRQGVDNQPYGTVDERMYAVLYPSGHPYSWDVIGYMEDLTAASKQDVEAFFKEYYSPANATLVVAGDIDPAATRKMVEKYFGPIPPGPPIARMKTWIPELDREVRLTMQDRVPLPRIYLAWHAPALFTAGTADLDVLAGVLASGKTSRLYKRLVYDLQIAQDVRAVLDEREIGSLFWVVVTAKPGHTLDEIEPIVKEEIERVRAAAPAAEEVERARTGILAGFVRGLEQIGGFGGKSDRLGMYNTYLGTPDWVAQDFARYQAVTPASIQAAAKRWLHDGRAVMRVEPFPEHKAAEAVAGLDRSKAPPIGEPARLDLPELKRAKLANGVEVVLAEAHEVPLVDLTLLVRGGWSSDPADKPGIASFATRMLDEGTRTRSALEISEQAQLLGANLSTTSNLDVSRVRVNALRARLDPALELWADVAIRPSFPADELERQRQQVLGQILQEKKQPFSMGIRILPKVLYGEGHPYGQPLTGSGTEESVKSVAREDLVAWHDTWYRPNNATVVVVGDTTLDEIVPRLERALAGWTAKPVPQIALPVRPQPERTTVYIVDKPGAAQSVLLLGQLTPPRNDPENVAFEVLNTVLGGEFGSRINMNLRETKGYTYGAYAFPFQARGQGTFVAYGEVRTDVTKESLVEMLKELREIRDVRPVTGDELRKAVDVRTLSLPGEYESLSQVAGKISDAVVYDLPADYYETYPDKVRAASVADLTALAGRRIQPGKLAIVVVGDRAAIEPGLRELELGPIQYLDVDGNPILQGARK